jgi:Fe2+ or Zn2+ uptake regulation protein
MGTLLEDAIQHLKKQGGRMTGQRRMILEMLECLGCHPTAEELYASVKPRDPSLSLSTVYRTLRWLEQEGLISARRFEEGSRKDRFDPASPNEHYHFLCTSCHQVIEFDDSRVEAIREQIETQFNACERTSLVLYGVQGAGAQALLHKAIRSAVTELITHHLLLILLTNPLYPHDLSYYSEPKLLGWRQHRPGGAPQCGQSLPSFSA